MSDTFKNDLDRIQRQIISVKSDLNKRDQLKQQGKPTGLKEGDIRGGLKDLEREFVLLDQLLKNQESSSATSLQQKECERKRNQYQDFLNQKNDLQIRFNNSLQQQKDQLFNNTSTQNKFEEKYDTNISNKDLYQIQKQQEADQDKQLDRVNDKLAGIKTTGLAMNENIKEQNKMLDQINLDVDQTSKQMMTTNSKMKKFIAKSSSCGLYIFISLEIVALALILLLL